MQNRKTEKRDQTAFIGIECELDGILDGIDVLNLLSVHPDIASKDRNAIAFAARGIRHAVEELISNLAGPDQYERFLSGR